MYQWYCTSQLQWNLATTRFALVQCKSLYRLLFLWRRSTDSNTSLSLANVHHSLKCAIAGPVGQVTSARASSGIA
jgi:hypothetical protein